MIEWPIRTLCHAGIRDILIVTGQEHCGDFIRLLGSGAKYGCRFTYRVQDGSGGIAAALSLAEGLVKDKFCVVLGDNIFFGKVDDMVRKYTVCGPGEAMLVLYSRPELDLKEFGVAEFALDPGKGKVLAAIHEKPEDPPTQWIQTGLYFYDRAVFDLIRTLEPSKRGELEVTDLNNIYIRDRKMKHCYYRGYWTDAGTFPTWLNACTYALGREI